jgi:hypothetical protein
MKRFGAIALAVGAVPEEKPPLINDLRRGFLGGVKPSELSVIVFAQWLATDHSAALSCCSETSNELLQ